MTKCYPRMVKVTELHLPFYHLPLVPPFLPWVQRQVIYHPLLLSITVGTPRNQDQTHFLKSLMSCLPLHHSAPLHFLLSPSALLCTLGYCAVYICSCILFLINKKEKSSSPYFIQPIIHLPLTCCFRILSSNLFLILHQL